MGAKFLRLRLISAYTINIYLNLFILVSYLLEARSISPSSYISYIITYMIHVRYYKNKNSSLVLLINKYKNTISGVFNVHTVLMNIFNLYVCSAALLNSLLEPCGPLVLT